ncbi:MAG: SpoIID/LytB domain-containing protein [Armatimonadota bacterium]
MTRRTLFRWPWMMLGVLLLAVLGLRGSQGQAQTTTLRIGLQTKQAEVRLQVNVPVQVQAPGAEPITLPAEQMLVFRPQTTGGTPPTGGILHSPDGTQVLAFTAPVQVRPVPADGPDPALIRLLGPSRHYDKKADRPYRGVMEIMPRAEGLTVVNVVGVEPYLYGVVSSEMSPSYPLEALKAQAVAARTYAVRNVGKWAAHGFDLDDTAASQVYGGYFSEDPRTNAAVDGTSGMVLMHDGKIVDAVYSSTCGGFTESAEEAWGRAVPYLVGIADHRGNIDPAFAIRPTDEAGWANYFKYARAFNCLQPKYARVEAFRWVKLMTRKELEAGLPADYQVGTVQNIVPLRRGLSGRITALRLEGSDRSVTISKELPIRKAFGGLRSSAFTVDVFRDDNGVPAVFAFWGAGWGHGLGMCQVGAVGLADQGWSYEKILTHYYRGTVLEKR